MRMLAMECMTRLSLYALALDVGCFILSLFILSFVGDGPCNKLATFVCVASALAWVDAWFFFKCQWEEQYHKWPCWKWWWFVTMVLIYLFCTLLPLLMAIPNHCKSDSFGVGIYLFSFLKYTLDFVGFAVVAYAQYHYQPPLLG